MAPRFNRPNISVESIEMRGGNLLQQTFAVKLNVQNPNDRALPVKGLHVELNVGGEEVASGVSDRAFVVAAFGESQFDMTIKANMALAVLKLADRMNQHADSVDYDLSGAASIDLPFLRDLPFHCKLPGPSWPPHPTSNWNKNFAACMRFAARSPCCAGTLR
jgi:LEA14-like dessication related protein